MRVTPPCDRRTDERGLLVRVIILVVCGTYKKRLTHLETSTRFLCSSLQSCPSPSTSTSLLYHARQDPRRHLPPQVQPADRVLAAGLAPPNKAPMAVSTLLLLPTTCPLVDARNNYVSDPDSLRGQQEGAQANTLPDYDPKVCLPPPTPALSSFSRLNRERRMTDPLCPTVLPLPGQPSRPRRRQPSV